MGILFMSLLIISLPPKKNHKIQLKYTILDHFLLIPKKGKRKPILTKSRQVNYLAMIPSPAISRVPTSKKLWVRLVAILLVKLLQTLLEVVQQRKRNRSKDLWQTIDPHLLPMNKVRKRSL